MLKKVLLWMITIFIGLPFILFGLYVLIIEPCIKGYNTGGWLGVGVAILLIAGVITVVTLVLKALFWALEQI